MKKINGAQTVEVIENRRIVLSAGVGTTKLKKFGGFLIPLLMKLPYGKMLDGLI